jgi:hypothetical protein
MLSRANSAGNSDIHEESLPTHDSRYMLHRYVFIGHLLQVTRKQPAIADPQARQAQPTDGQTAAAHPPVVTEASPVHLKHKALPASLVCLRCHEVAIVPLRACLLRACLAAVRSLGTFFRTLVGESHLVRCATRRFLRLRGCLLGRCRVRRACEGKRAAELLSLLAPGWSSYSVRCVPCM